MALFLYAIAYFAVAITIVVVINKLLRIFSVSKLEALKISLIANLILLLSISMLIM